MLAVCAIVLAVPSAASAAKLSGDDVFDDAIALSTDFNLPAYPADGLGGGYVSCPAGLNIFTGGAFVYPTGGTPKPTALIFLHVGSSTPTTDGNGWYADASNGTTTPYTLRVELVCMPEEYFAGRQVITESAAVGNGETDGQTARCSQGRRAYTGGTFWSTPGGPAPSTAGVAWVGASTPNGKATSWFGSGKAFAPLDLYVSVHCLPSNRLAKYEKRQLDVNVPPGKDRAIGGKCPGSHPAVGPAGTFLHKPGKRPTEAMAGHTHLSNVGVHVDAERFYGGGRNINTNASLTARAFCLAK